MSPFAKHVIHQHQPLRWAMIIIGIVLLTAISIWLYLKPTTHLRIQFRTLQQHSQQLETVNQQLTEQNLELAQKFESQQQIMAIQQARDEQLQNQLSKLQTEVVHLNKELMFYQNITQGSSSSKLQIRELDLRASDSQSDMVDYRLVITQSKKISKPLTGAVTITLNSQNNGENEQLIVGEHQLNLRHVQVFEGQIQLVSNSVPENISVTLKQAKKKKLSRSFDWQIDSNN
ncbi:MAG: hypothetical protein DRQ39_04840 [Gammaproteobacteria bacterium]|nr:MAG: hypothetical protein DRQ39_04840 [Gammaproteobacteria bacterium]RKZ95173.1 MAG: hypothetical protein DRQ40_04230 [Gammaproteobacteria bacterium]RKZ98465.1 MAG: hypothetical protein DRQ46_02035 [Gammaproteobacteria bacterium]RKZ99748.1 MAG: hypothetical protein DRQ42_07070 [Gammaproteobacteria bacterium]HHA19222.1 hypothetical protein [Methylophaga sp.]